MTESPDMSSYMSSLILYMFSSMSNPTQPDALEHFISVNKVSYTNLAQLTLSLVCQLHATFGGMAKGV